MANATWKAIEKVFASETTTTTLGSTITGSPQTSTDPEILSVNWNKGLDGNWQEVTINGTKYWLPLISEWNGIYSCFSQYFKQLFENGFVLWSEKQTYNLTPAPSVVKDPVSSKLYITLVDNNKGNLLTDNTKWKFLCDLNDLTYLQSSKFNTANNLVQTNSANQLPALDGTLLLNTKYIPQRIILSNNTTNPNTQIDFSSGNFVFSDNSGFASLSTITKRLDANWVAGTNQGGLFTGTKQANSTYHCIAIYNPTTQISDVGFLLGIAGVAPDPTNVLPNGFTKWKRIGSIMTNSSGNIILFKQRNKYFEWKDIILDVNLSTVSSTKTPIPVSVPLGIETLVNIRAGVFNSYAVDFTINISSTYNNILTPIGGDGQTYDTDIGSDNNYVSVTNMLIGVDTSSNIAYQASSSGTVTLPFRVRTRGYFDYNL